MPQDIVELGWPRQKRGAKLDILSWGVEMANKVRGVVYIARGLLFELYKVELNCVLDRLYFLVRVVKVLRFDIFDPCLVTNFTSSNCCSVAVMSFIRTVLVSLIYYLEIVK